MKTIKLIDLYKLIASDELKNETKFKYSGDYFKYWKTSKQIDRYTDNTYNTVEYYNDNLFDIDFLDDVVEIIEDTPKEDKKIEKLDLSDWYEITSIGDCKPEMLSFIFNKNAKAFSSKINEIIDKVNGEDND